MKKCLNKHKGLFIISIILGIIYAIGTVLSSKILQNVIDAALEGNMDEFKEILLFTIIFLIGISILTYVYGYLNIKLKNVLLQDYREDIYSGVMKMNYKEFNSQNTADYISALTNDIKMIEENYLTSLLLVIQYVFIFIATLIMLFMLNLIVTISLIISVLLMFIVPSVFGKNLQEKQDMVSSKLTQFTAKTKDILSGFEVIKTFNVFHHFNKIFTSANKEVTDNKMQADGLLVLNESVSSLLGTLCQFVVVFVSTYLILQGEITAGTTVALIQLSGTFIMPVITILSNFPKIKGIEPIIKKLDAIADLNNTNTAVSEAINFNDTIEINNLSFAYDEVQVLNNVSTKFEKGKKYAILGKSGCGKTTLTKLVSGYYDSYSGMISYDGKDIKEFSVQSSNNLISTIHQNVYMFDTNIENNITLYDTYPEDTLYSSVKNSGIDKFIHEQADGLNSEVGENGNKLSGGQKQRIAIARALIKNTPILILDEGTSAIDRQTAHEIEGELLKLNDLTLITITHNLDVELLSKYDEIIYMENGCISESGPFGELISKEAKFSHYFNNTLNEFEANGSIN
ncbi:ABC transporter ATP-binding protein [Breznakia pachnodae]|uniref:ABC-type multidrug transport system fused ATPase/permease subunit n=1 Tax=Breznakia pachnodae TaxID=265178 RepID=A0ABU0E5J6_9FIRM|nr:ABC transporter ATP-binding protein [Breznakia pachnodae]MDQ0361988.1 ABC-type multidrug transport system fused ATPase/permease subunit [Breznakia pachnodae]